MSSTIRLAWKLHSKPRFMKMHHKHSKTLVLLCLTLMQLTGIVESNTDNGYSPGQGTHEQYSKPNVPLMKYPKDHEIVRANLERFEEYYKCLNEFKMVPMAHYVFPGTSVSLHCDACISPRRESVEWQYANKATNFTPKILKSDTTVNKHSQTVWSSQTEYGRTLNIYRLSMEESGHYSCLQDGNVITPHLVQVADSTDNLSRVNPQNGPKGPYPCLPFNITEMGVKIWFKWNDWSVCSNCDEPGKRLRIGICMVSSFENNNSTDVQVLKIFPNGIPCRSNLLPTSIKNHPRVLSSNNEYMVEYCQESCPRSKKYILKETGGVLLKKLANLPDPFTLVERLPHIFPPVQHTALYLTQWDTGYFQCPGSDYNNAPVHWRLGLNLLLKENERVQLTPTDILIIKDLSITDSNIYSCWQRNRLVGTIRLTVSQPIRLSFEEQLNTVVLILIIVSFLIITIRIFKAYLKRRKIAKKLKT